MTEVEWESGTDPDLMLRVVLGKVSGRKLQLFACGCCRRVAHLSSDERLLLAIESSERYADGLSTSGELLAAWEAADAAVWAFNGVVSEQLALAAVETITRSHTFQECPRICRSAAEAREQERAWLPWEQRSSIWWSGLRARAERVLEEEQRHQADLLRCVVGNPFGFQAADSRWPASAASLARSIYQERAFERLPILADTLEDAGCDDVELLAHCRSGTPHARGCRALDLILGRE